MARYDDATRGQVKAAIAFVRGRVAEEHTCRGTWCELMGNVGKKVRMDNRGTRKHGDWTDQVAVHKAEKKESHER